MDICANMKITAYIILLLVVLYFMHLKMLFLSELDVTPSFWTATFSKTSCHTGMVY